MDQGNQTQVLQAPSSASCPPLTFGDLEKRAGPVGGSAGRGAVFISVVLGGLKAVFKPSRTLGILVAKAGTREPRMGGRYRGTVHHPPPNQ